MTIRDILSTNRSAANIDRLISEQRDRGPGSVSHDVEHNIGTACPVANIVSHPNAVTINLPWPPSANHYWRHRVAGKLAIVYVSADGKAYKWKTAAAVSRQFSGPAIDYRCQVLIEAWSPDRRSWDVDNREKPLLDALAAAGLFVNDKLVRRLAIDDCGVDKPGRVRVHVMPLGSMADFLRYLDRVAADSVPLLSGV